MPADGVELVRCEAAQLVLREAALADQVPEDEGKDGVAEVELAVDVFCGAG